MPADTGRGTGDAEVHPAVQILCGRTQEQQALCLFSQKSSSAQEQGKKSQQPNHTQKAGVPRRKYRTNTVKVLSPSPVFTLEVHLKTLNKDLRFYSHSGHRYLASCCEPRTTQALEHSPATLAKIREKTPVHKRLNP